MADIESMFLQIRVPDSNKDFTRVLWWEDGDIQKPIKPIFQVINIVVVFSSENCLSLDNSVY